MLSTVDYFVFCYRYNILFISVLQVYPTKKSPRPIRSRGSLYFLVKFLSHLDQHIPRLRLYSAAGYRSRVYGKNKHHYFVPGVVIDILQLLCLYPYYASRLTFRFCCLGDEIGLCVYPFLGFILRCLFGFLWFFLDRLLFVFPVLSVLSLLL